MEVKMALQNNPGLLLSKKGPLVMVDIMRQGARQDMKLMALGLLDRSGSPEKAGQRAVSLGQRTAELRPGTTLGREWNGQMHRVVVLTEGFAWNGKTYRSLTKVALAITRTRWSGPKFFGLRDSRSKRSAP